jgi:hypothetical protein
MTPPAAPRGIAAVGVVLATVLKSQSPKQLGIRHVAFRRHTMRRAGTIATVRVHVRSLAQMFNELDPSPFWDRDLDAAAAQFIEDEFREKLSAHTWHLDVHVLDGAELATDLQAAVEHYYERLAGSARLKLRENLRVAQFALLGGIAIFLACMTIRQLLSGMSASRFINEGLVVLAWLALWRPTEALVYGWVPLYRQRRLYQRLAGIRVTVRSEASTRASAEPSPPTRNT